MCYREALGAWAAWAAGAARRRARRRACRRARTTSSCRARWGSGCCCATATRRGPRCAADTPTRSSCSPPRPPKVPPPPAAPPTPTLSHPHIDWQAYLKHGIDAQFFYNIPKIWFCYHDWVVLAQFCNCFFCCYFLWLSRFISYLRDLLVTTVPLTGSDILVWLYVSNLLVSTNTRV